jgi:hypothetical protein
MALSVALFETTGITETLHPGQTDMGDTLEATARPLVLLAWVLL